MEKQEAKGSGKEEQAGFARSSGTMGGAPRFVVSPRPCPLYPPIFTLNTSCHFPSRSTICWPRFTLEAARRTRPAITG